MKTGLQSTCTLQPYNKKSHTYRYVSTSIFMLYVLMDILVLSDKLCPLPINKCHSYCPLNELQCIISKLTIIFLNFKHTCVDKYHLFRITDTGWRDNLNTPILHTYCQPYCNNCALFISVCTCIHVRNQPASCWVQIRSSTILKNSHNHHCNQKVQ